ncbi:hypothetical protein NKJ46_34000 [Mesorhizobium sp. M0166]|uniref:endonuclease/exonuclease/phosphatase family protein n=1 Tax=Mesorhizobium sp. M0166 TaxID=2956902 RepID=UPI00333BA96B
MLARFGLGLYLLTNTNIVSISNAAGATLANWNVQTLTYNGDPITVFPGDFHREDVDFKDLRRWRDLVAADVYFLQEVTSPAAIDEVFPVVEGWRHCISGQYAKAEGLPIKPVCSGPGDTPHKPTGPTRAQYTAVALRAGSPFSILDTADDPALNVKSLDGGVERDIRWGLEVTLGFGEAKLRVLVVHLKSGCFDDQIKQSLWLNPPVDPPSSWACDTLGRQLYPLRAWITLREAAGEAWMVVGDFNRRLDAGSGTFQDEVWKALSGYIPDKTGHDTDTRPDIPMFRSPYKEASVCWGEFRNPNPATLADADDFNLLPIEFFLFGTKASAMVVPNSGRQVAWPHAIAADAKRLSDHCPASLLVLSN